VSKIFQSVSIAKIETNICQSIFTGIESGDSEYVFLTVSSTAIVQSSSVAGNSSFEYETIVLSRWCS
jgi:hypothetical protein